MCIVKNTLHSALSGLLAPSPAHYAPMERNEVIPAGTTTTLIVPINASDSEASHNVTVEDGATCTVITINAADRVKILQKGMVGADAKLLWQNITIGGSDVTHDLVSHVTGANGESAVDWMFYTGGTDKQALSVRNIFDGREGSGEILMRGVAEETGYASAKGMIEIGLQGGGTNTYLTQEVLMLDASAKIDAVPGLEIKTNDVKASHSATVSRVSPEDLFYFASRGIPKNEARAMYVQGFLGMIADRIADEKVREDVRGLIEKKYRK